MTFQANKFMKFITIKHHATKYNNTNSTYFSQKIYYRTKVSSAPHNSFFWDQHNLKRNTNSTKCNAILWPSFYVILTKIWYKKTAEWNIKSIFVSGCTRKYEDNLKSTK